MPYIGKTPLTGAYQLCDTITTSATATYNLTVGSSPVIPGAAQNCIVSLNGVVQAPVSAYTVSGSTITFASTLSATDVIDFILILGNVFDIGKPTDGSVTNASVASNAAIALSKLATTGTMTFASTIGVGGATPAASGAGITFPASASASTNANTLDDYEEGTWTPSIGGTATYTSRYGRYVKIGKMVSVQFAIVVNTLGTGSVELMEGLPFTSENIGALYAQQTGCVSYFGSLAVNTIFIAFYIQNNNTNMYFVGKATSGATCDNGIDIFGNGTEIYGSATYMASA
jgi:hypothetical protein